MAVLLSSGCSQDEAPGGDWQLDDRAQWGRQDLGGPPGRSYEFRGRIGERLYFSAATQREGGYPHKLRAFSYSPGEGWRFNSSLASILSSADSRGRDRIREFGGAHYYLHDEFGPTLYRSEDAGQTWQTAPLPPPVASDEVFADQLTSDGQTLYVLTGGGSESSSNELWRLDEDGTSWSLVRDDVERGVLASGPGVIAVQVEDDEGWDVRVSGDRGQTWASWEKENLEDERRWVPYQGGYVFPHGGGREAPPQIGRMTDDDEFEEIEVEGAPADISRLRRVGDDIFAATRGGGALGRLTDELQRFEPIEMPEDDGLRSSVLFPTFFALDSETLGAVTDTGMWTTGDAGQSWTFVGHGYSRVDEVVDAGVQTLAADGRRLFLRDDEGAWSRLRLEELPGRVDELNECGSLVLLTATSGDLYAYDPASDTAEMYWENPDFDGAEWRGKTSVVCATGEVFIGTANAEMPSQDGRGGLFLSDGEAFARLDEQYPGGDSPRVYSLAYYDGALWVLADEATVWRVEPGSGTWSRAHQNLPTDVNRYTGERIERLVSTPHGLFAHSDTQVWHRDGGDWRPVLDQAFRAEAEVTGAQASDESYIAGLTYIEGGLLVATSRGLYVVEPASGAFEVLDDAFDAPVTGVANQVSGIYVSTMLGGLVHYERALF